MSGAIAHEQAQHLRNELGRILWMHDAGKASTTFDTFLRLVDILETSPGAVVFPTDELLSTQEVAELLGVSRMTVVRLIERGDLAATGGGVHRRIAASELARYQEAAIAKRRQSLLDLAQQIGDDTPPDQIIRTR